jgi:hypothetical protein
MTEAGLPPLDADVPSSERSAIAAHLFANPSGHVSRKIPFHDAALR